MKLVRIAFFAITAIFSKNGYAQTIITEKDMMQIGKKIKLAHSIDSTLSPKIDSLSKSWDFSKLIADTTSNLEIESTSWTNYANDFPESTIAIHSKNTYQFAGLDSSALKAYGAIMKNPFTNSLVKVKFSTPETMLQFPMNKDSKFSSQTKYQITIDTTFTLKVGLFTGTVSKVRISGTRKHQVTSNNFGQLKTPFGNYPSLLVEDNLIETDSVFITIKTIIGTNEIPLPNGILPNIKNPIIDTTTSYTWWANNVGYALLNFNYKNGKSSGVNWLKELPLNSSIKDVYQSTISLYPNPSNEMLIITNTTNESYSFNLFMCDGKLVKSLEGSGNKTVVNLNDYTTGLYFYTITNLKNEIIKSDKILINKN